MAGILSKLAGGVDKFSNELLTPASALGRLGAYLGAASGTDLGRAQLLAQQDARQQKMDMFGAEDRDLERQYKQAQLAALLNPKPVNNDTVNDYNFIKSVLGDDAGKSFLSNLASGPPIAVDVQQADGSVVRQFMPRAQFAAPRTAPQGVTFTPLDEGGPTQPASGSFPR